MREKLGFTIASTFKILAALALFGGLQAPVVYAQDAGCDVSSLSGAYGYTLSGFVYDNQGYMYMIGAAGRVVADGKGGLTGADTYSFDGTIYKRQYTGTYTMNADCTGSATFTTTNGIITHADLVAVNSAKEVNLVQTDVAFILTGVLKLQGAVPAPPASSTTPAGSAAQ